MPATSLLVSIRGGYVTGRNSVEKWSFGIRMVPVYGTVDNKGKVPLNISVEDSAIELDETDYTYTENFRLVASTGPGAPFQPQGWVPDGLRQGIETWWRGAALCSNQTRLEEIVCYPIESPTGRVVGGHSARVTYKTPIPGSGGASLLPPEVARVVSWTTDRLGPKGKGRIYLPGAETNQVDTDGGIKAGTVNVMVPGAAQMLEDIAFSGIATNLWNVRPAVIGKPYTDYAVVTGVRMGRIFDAQRRRRNQLDEAYTSEAVTY